MQVFEAMPGPPSSGLWPVHGLCLAVRHRSTLTLLVDEVEHSHTTTSGAHSYRTVGTWSFAPILLTPPFSQWKRVGMVASRLNLVALFVDD